jgi:hypothetical protein
MDEPLQPIYTVRAGVEVTVGTERSCRASPLRTAALILVTDQQAAHGCWGARGGRRRLLLELEYLQELDRPGRGAEAAKDASPTDSTSGSWP